MNESHCPKCGVILNAAIDPSRTRQKPKSGDYSVCVKCGQLLMFNDETNLVLVTDEQFNLLPEDLQRYLKKAVHYINSLKPN